MQAVLVMFRAADDDRRAFNVTKEITVIGRREDCDLRIPLGEVSRKHCRIIRDDEELRLEDLGSSNGTYLNGQRVQEAPLAAGDTVQVGPVAFVLQIDGLPGNDDLQPVRVAAADVAATADNDATVRGPQRSSAPGEEEIPELEGLEPMPESEALGEDAGFDILAGDEAEGSGAPIDLDAEHPGR